jgi:hypothetical protein
MCSCFYSNDVYTKPFNTKSQNHSWFYIRKHNGISHTKVKLSSFVALRSSSRYGGLMRSHFLKFILMRSSWIRTCISHWARIEFCVQILPFVTMAWPVTNCWRPYSISVYRLHWTYLHVWRFSNYSLKAAPVTRPRDAACHYNNSTLKMTVMMIMTRNCRYMATICVGFNQ